MSTKMGFWRWALASAAILIATGTAGARVIDPTGVTTSEPAAIVLYPRLKVDLNTCIPKGGTFPALQPDADVTAATTATAAYATAATCNLTFRIACATDTDCRAPAIDTIVQLTNTSEFLTRVECFYTNTNSHCSNAPDDDLHGRELPRHVPAGRPLRSGWTENDFLLTLTKRQPLSWSVNDGSAGAAAGNHPGQGEPPQFNEGNIPPAPEIPFTGELLCIQLDIATELPTDRND